MTVYFNGNFIRKENVRISPDDRGFTFADGVYEVIRSYNGVLFRAEDHLKRLNRSLRELRIVFQNTDKLKGIAKELIIQNRLENDNALVYIQITRGQAPRQHSFPKQKIPPTVYVSAFSFQPYRNEWEEGIKIIIVPDIRWGRCDIKSVALLPNVLARQQAGERGAEETVFVRDGVITEGTHTSLCAVFDGNLLTHPVDNNILDGITRKVVSELCSKLNIPFVETPIYKNKLKEADEVMVLSTSVEIVPVVQVDDWKVRSGKPGPVTRKLQREFREMVNGIR